MKNINIILYFSNTKYADSLARGLCYECTGLNVFFAKNPEDIKSFNKKDVLLTDIDGTYQCQAIYFGEEYRDREKYSLLKTCTLSEIIEKIKEVAYSEHGIKIYRKEQSRQVIEVYSQKGGTGVTTFAIILARLISMRTESKVLYLNLGVLDDYYKYDGIDCYEGLKSKRHFLFMKDEGIDINIENYCKKDDWNVYYFKPEDNRNSFFEVSSASDVIEIILNEEFFSYIIVDRGKTKKPDDIGQRQIELIENKLLYTIGDSTEKYIINRDLQSLNFEANSVEISIRGNLANSIDCFIEESDILY